MTTFEKIFKNLDVEKASGKYQIFAPVIAFHLAVHQTKRLHTFSLQCRKVKIKHWYKNRIKTEAENYRPIFQLPLILKVIGSELLRSFQSCFRATHSTDMFLSIN